ncbi:hypothetical protein [Aeromicrobium sp. CF3.5]|uniref:hypothetical protein n=1 Tax=Aeromicrobium sp. CF3.5 TaxID=3373078 RepID=UPI003EE7AA8E
MTISAFTGHIAGIGTTSGTRLILGMWDDTPLGPFADAMIETAAGHRVLVAPRRDVADFIAATYSFDEVVLAPVKLTRGDRWQMTSNDLNVTFTPGRQRWMSPLLRAVPSPVHRTAAWAKVCSPIASRLMPGVQTYGTAGSGRDEWYAARHVRLLDTASARWRGEDLGNLALLTPPVRFGFASAPARPSLTALTSYVRQR